MTLATEVKTQLSINLLNSCGKLQQNPEPLDHLIPLNDGFPRDTHGEGITSRTESESGLTGQTSWHKLLYTVTIVVTKGNESKTCS